MTIEAGTLGWIAFLAFATVVALVGMVICGMGDD
jgi:hypothetical protein